MPVQQTLYKNQEVLRISSPSELEGLTLSLTQARLVLENLKYIESFVKNHAYNDFKNLGKEK